MVRHLHSLRRMQRDHGWIHTLLEEAENERMHLMTFLQLRNPGPLFGAAVQFTQFVFTGAFFLSYMVSQCLEQHYIYTLWLLIVKCLRGLCLFSTAKALILWFLISLEIVGQPKVLPPIRWLLGGRGGHNLHRHHQNDRHWRTAHVENATSPGDCRQILGAFTRGKNEGCYSG